MGMSLCRRWMTIGGVNLDTFNCHLLMPGISSAPERDVEIVTVPGRNGDVVIDNNRFKNETVQYKCVIDGSDSQYDFERMMAWLKSLKGYQRIEECYHPDYYRMGVFNASIDPDATQNTQQVAFTLTANCKPQRYLKSGEQQSDNVIPAELNAEWAGKYRTPNFAVTSTTVFRIKPIGDLTNLSASDCTIENLWEAPTLPADAVTTWQAGNYVDLSTGFTDDTVFQLYLNTAYTWLIETDELTGSVERYTIKASDTVVNSTFYEASPLFVIRAVNDEYSETSTYFMQFIVNGIRVRVLRTFATDHSGCPLYIDCDTQNCYYIDGGARQNANGYVSLVNESTGAVTTDFPKFAVGSNTVVYEYESALNYTPFSAMAYLPRWWTV